MTTLTIVVTDRQGETRTLAAHVGDTLMQVLRDQVDLTIGTCGGAISCGTCLVSLSPQWQAAIADPGNDEAEMLEALSADGNCRLSCQLMLDAAADGGQATLVAE